MSTAIYHHADGLSDTEYDELVRYFRNRFEWSGTRYDARLVKSVLFHADTYRKCKALGELLETRLRSSHLGNLGFELQRFHFRFNFVTMKRLRDRKWLASVPANKATILKRIDDFVVKLALADHPDRRDVKLAIERNRARWASKKMPFMRRRRSGPRKGVSK